MESHQENRHTFVSRQDWSFRRRGEQDEARHNEKVKEAIKGNLDQVISDGNIITADPNSKKTIKIPLRSIELPRFKYGNPEEGVGTGDGDAQPGDFVDDGDGDGEPGDRPGEEYYEAEITIDEIQELVFEDLGLPRIKPKSNIKDIETEREVFTDVRKKKSTNNLDIGRTVLQNMLRNAQETGEAIIKNINSEDYRVRTWEQEKKPENSAVVIAMADISGSMGDFEKYITRAFCWWTVGFLRSKYPKVEIVFITHDTNATESTEEQFFSRGSGGGTKCSSANQLTLDIINDRYPPDGYNIYPLHFSDGDNWGGDNEKCVELVKKMLEMDISQYAYVQIGRNNRSQLFNDYDKKLDDPRYKGLIINEKQEVLPALKEVFSSDE